MVMCECGCGQPAPIANKTRGERGQVKGQPVSFIVGHNARGRKPSEKQLAVLRDGRELLPNLSGVDHPNWKGERVGYHGLHAWVNRHKTKTGICVECGASPGSNGMGGTQWANISGEYRRDLDDFRELCPRCNQMERSDRAA